MFANCISCFSWKTYCRLWRLLQLPPIAMANHELVRKWLGEDMFYHAGIVDSVDQSEAHPNLFMLQEQRRMHADVFQRSLRTHLFMKK